MLLIKVFEKSVSNACKLNALLFAGYFRDNIFCHFVASMISGFVTTCASMPVDIAKTRYLYWKTM